MNHVATAAFELQIIRTHRPWLPTRLGRPPDGLFDSPARCPGMELLAPGRPMSRFAKKLAEICADQLQPGETYLWGIRAKPAWNIRAALGGAAAGAVAGATGSMAMSTAGDSGKNQEEARAAAAGFPYPGSMAVALTDRRLLVYERSLLFGYLKGFAGDFPLSAVESVKMFNEKGLGDRFLIRVSDGDPIRIFGVRRDGTQQFLERLRELL